MSIKINNQKVNFTTFPNMETKMDEKQISEIIRGEYVLVITFKFESDSDFIKLLFLKKYLDEVVDKKQIEMQLTIVYMPYSRMDRSENGSAFTLKYITEFINSMNFDAVLVLEPHSDVTPALIENVYVENVTPHLWEIAIKDIEFDKDNDYLVFPDGGASKRYGDVDGFNILVGNKKRNFETGRIDSLSLTGDLNNIGKKAVIWDDLTSYGGTFVRTAKELRKLGVEEVYLIVAHAENSVFKDELFAHIDKVYTTDSIISEQNYWENKKYEKQLHIIKLEATLND